MGIRRRTGGVDIVRGISRLESARSIRKLRLEVSKLRASIESDKGAMIRVRSDGHDGRANRVSRQYLLSELRQIEGTRTVGRARYYVNRLKKALTEVRRGRVNDINLNRWKEYSSILTDSLWVLEKRDSSGPHSAWYWGNFVPQIPYQLMHRYTKRGEWVLDPFAGSGTTLLECLRLGRNGLGVELQPSVARRARLALQELARQNGATRVALEVGDSTRVDFRALLRRNGVESVQLVILHPPYHDIIRFSRNRRDLSNARTTREFAEGFGAVVDRVTPVLASRRFLAVVIGDKYEKGEWIPLGFLTMNEVLNRRYTLKSIIVKNFEETLGKRNRQELWRYRALAGGFYVFKHEYIFIFQKNT
ncbi:MAG: DNA methyltransferase [Ignavibacteria bacterium]|nr:DNA methyltransferase [Ignavibacteria bacterium]